MKSRGVRRRGVELVERMNGKLGRREEQVDCEETEQMTWKIKIKVRK